MQLSEKSLKKLDGVHPDLVKVVKRAIEITKTDFTVTEGVRTKEKQAENVRRGVSKTMNSKHLPQADGFGHAVDIYPFVNGKMVNDWNVPWLSRQECVKAWDDVPRAIKQAASELGVTIEWGGEWNSFPDGPHYQIA